MTETAADVAAPLRRALVDLSAIAANLDLLGAGPSRVVDLRGRAWGLDAALVGPVVAEAGVRRVLVDDEPAAVRTAALGLDAAVHDGPAPDGAIGAELAGLADRVGAALDPALRPALELRAVVVTLKRAPAGAGVSYGHTYVTSSATALALVGVGYGDGLPRSAGGLGPVALGGAVHRVAGRMAMDALILDLGPDAAGVAVGDEAVLFGDPRDGVPSAGDWGDAVGRSAAEIVSRLQPRVPRIARSGVLA